MNDQGTPLWRKRLVDLVVGVPLLVVAFPVIAVLAVAVTIQFRANPFFVQERIGHRGRPFRCPKLRSLPPETPPYALKTEVDLVDTRLGRFLRRTHLDELPQLFLVPFGRLSLVGPRPKMPDRFEPAPDDYVQLRTMVPQGCTGLWQISPDTNRLPHESPQYDLYYVLHGSLRLDLWILWRTARQAFRPSATVALTDVPHRVRGRGWVDGGALPRWEIEESPPCEPVRAAGVG